MESMSEFVSSNWLCVSLSVAAALFFHTVVKLLVLLWWRPKRIEQDFANQSIKGPPYRFFHGNVKEMVGMMIKASSKPMSSPTSLFSHDILPRVLSFYPPWKKIYGSTFLMWFGPTARIVIEESDLIREIFFSNSVAYDKYESHPLVRQLEGDGLLGLSGEKWAHHRKVVSKVFNSENLKMLVPNIAKSVLEMLERWPTKSSDEVEIDVSEWFQSVTEDAITRAAFGISYVDGKTVFQLQAKQMKFVTEAFQNVFIPGHRFLPTRKNLESWKVDREIKRSLFRMIESRKKTMLNDPSGRSQTDLLGHLIATSLKKSTPAETPVLSVSDIVDECKTFFFAGKHTTSNLLIWATVLLAMHPDWQHKARQEVFQVFGRNNQNSHGRADVVPTRDHVTKLKTLKMIVNETLRLYPPVIAVIRRAKSDVELSGRYKIPKGTELMIPIMALHHDSDLWGNDVHEFNPARFEETGGVSYRRDIRFIPFGLGARTCVGKNLALLESMLTLAIILQRFSFRLSPAYVHAPTVLLLLHPQFGAPVIFTPLD